ncbi:MAG: hypothetical protein CVT95_12125, partial [Bacteroidetes bacterium HGW-Bacteroidetes-12]
MQLLLSDAKTIERENWSDFILEHPLGNVFQTPEIVDVYETTKNYEPVTLFASKENKLIGVLVGVIQKENRGILGCFSSRCIIIGGPIVKDNDSETIDFLLLHLVKLVRKKTIYIQFRNIFELQSFNYQFSKHGFRFEPHLDILINLDKPFESLKESIHKSRLRNLTKAINKGIEIKKMISNSEIISGFKLVKSTYNRLKIPSPDISLFEAI